MLLIHDAQHTGAKNKCVIDTWMEDILILTLQKSKRPLDIINDGYINVKVHPKREDKYIFHLK